MLACIIEDIICDFLGLSLEWSSTVASLLPTMPIITSVAPTAVSIGVVITAGLLRGGVWLDILLIIPHCYFVM